MRRFAEYQVVVLCYGVGFVISKLFVCLVLVVCMLAVCTTDVACGGASGFSTFLVIAPCPHFLPLSHENIMELTNMAVY